jgi:hypothetical protein
MLAAMMRRLACVLLLAACSDLPAMTARDASPEASADVPPDAPNDAAPKDVTVDAGPPPEPGSTEALLDEVCAGRPRRGEPATFAYSTAPMMMNAGSVRDLRPGDFEAVHLVVEQPVRIERLRLTFRGMAGGRVRVKITDDHGRSNPEVTRDLVEPVELDYRDAEPVTVTLPRPVDLHPARHAWVVVEHLTEPMSLAIAATRGGSYRSYFRSEALIERLMAMGGDSATFRWIQLAGMGNVALEYAVEAQGQWICPRVGAPWFTDATMASGLRGTTNQTSAVDVDGDGWDDLVGTRSTMTADTLQVWRNRRDGTFEDITARTGLDAATGRMSLWGDFDGDGDADVYAGVYRDGVGPFTPAFPSRVWRQGADGRFTVEPYDLEPAGPTAAGSVGDCDGDGALDLFVGQWLRQYPRNPAPDFLFRGDAMGRFTLGSTAAGLPGRPDGRPTYGVTWVDFDNDGDRDVFVANYGGNANDAWRNDGRCRLTNVAGDLGVDGDGKGSPGTSFGFAFGDYDNDGDLDAHETNIAHPRYDDAGIFTDHSRLLRNQGAPTWAFEDVAVASGILYTEGDISSAWGDYDNDGDLDLYVATTYPFQFSRLYRQESDHRFSDVTWLAGTATELNGRALWLDVDRDGDLDLVTGPSGNWTLHRNEIRSSNHWIELRLAAPTGNTAAIGARVTVRDANNVTRIRDVEGGGATWGTQASGLLHVGLGAASGAVRVSVRWPDGMTTEAPDLAVDRAWRIPRTGAPTALPR